MKKGIAMTLTLSMLMSLPLGGISYAQTTTKSTTIDYMSEIQLNQFRPHGGDRAEISGFIESFVKNVKTPKEISKFIIGNTTQKNALEAYIKRLATFKDIKIVGATAEKLYRVKQTDIFSNSRALIKFKYLGYTTDGKIIEFTDYIGAGKFGKEETDWKLDMVVFKDSGIDVSNASLEQLNPPKKGEEICIMTTSIGTIKLRLFPAQAPKAVKNFKTLAEKGYYNNTEFYRVIKDFMIQGGSPDNTGDGGKSIYEKSFEDEFSRDLHNFRGALSMANTGVPTTNDSQFFFVQKPTADVSHLDLASLPLNVEEMYLKIGGTPHLDMRHTVFGQIYEGLDVLDKAVTAEVNEEARPLKDAVKIVKIEFVPAP